MRSNSRIHGPRQATPRSAAPATVEPLFGPPAGVPKADRGKERLRAVLIGLGLGGGGVALTAWTHIPAFAPLGFIALGVFLAHRAKVELRVPALFAILAFYLAGSLTTDPTTAKTSRQAFKPANTANVSASAGAVTALPTLAGVAADKLEDKLAESRFRMLVGDQSEQATAEAGRSGRR